MKKQKQQEQKELLSLTNDYVFRRIFGKENVSSLADFLAAVLDIPQEELTRLTVDDPNMHRKHKGGKRNELDVRVHTKDGKIIDVEIQVCPEDAFKERIAYLNSRIFSEQLKRGGKYEELNRTISVIITEFELFKDNEDCHNRFLWYNPTNGVSLTDVQEINTLELEKMPESNDGTKLWLWLRFLMSKEEEEMEALAADNEAMKDVIVTLREMSANEAERRLADAREKERRDRFAAKRYGEKEGEARGIKIGEARGIEIGKKEGEAKTRLEIARNLKAVGVDKASIVKASGLTAKEVDAL